MKWRRFILLLLWILSLVGITFYGGAISYGLFWGITLIPVLSLVYLLFVFMQFRIYQEIGSRIIVCKQPVSYFFILQNETVYAFAGLSVRLFSDFSYVTDMPENEVRMWYNPDQMENRQRAVFLAGSQVLDPNLVSIYYTNY